MSEPTPPKATPEPTISGWEHVPELDGLIEVRRAGERAKELSTARADIGTAFAAWEDYAEDQGNENDWKICGETRERAMAFLAKLEAREAEDQRQLAQLATYRAALAACHVLAESINDKEVARAKRMAREVISGYGVQGGMNAR